MMVGIDAAKRPSARGNCPSVQVLCASMDRWCTRDWWTFRTRDISRRGEDFTAPPGELLEEAFNELVHQNDRLPEQLFVYRGGVGAEQEEALIEAEVYGSGGVFSAVEEAGRRYGDDTWRKRFRLAFVLTRRGTHARFRTHASQNLDNGTVIESGVVEEGLGHAGAFQFYLKAQSVVVGTARTPLYTVRTAGEHPMPRETVVQVTYDLCGLVQTFPGFCSLPAPLHLATKFKNQLGDCAMHGQLPPQPRPVTRPLQGWPIMV